MQPVDAHEWALSHPPMNSTFCITFKATSCQYAERRAEEPVEAGAQLVRYPVSSCQSFPGENRSTITVQKDELVEPVEAPERVLFLPPASQTVYVLAYAFTTFYVHRKRS